MSHFGAHVELASLTSLQPALDLDELVHRCQCLEVDLEMNGPVAHRVITWNEMAEHVVQQCHDRTPVGRAAASQMMSSESGVDDTVIVVAADDVHWRNKGLPVTRRLADAADDPSVLVNRRAELVGPPFEFFGQPQQDSRIRST